MIFDENRSWLFCEAFLEQKFGPSSTLLRQQKNSAPELGLSFPAIFLTTLPPA
jgi:hypothetical protein